jgi:hypothetical protein
MLDPGVTPPTEWRGGRFSGQYITLPSGNRARVKRTLSLITAMENGTLPNPLSKHIDTMLKMGMGDPNTTKTPEEQQTEALKQFANMDQEAMVQLFRLIDDEIVEIFVSPRVVRAPKEDEAGNPIDPAKWQPEEPDTLALADLTWEDKLFAYNFAQGAPTDLARFRDAQTVVAALADELKLQVSSEHAGVD